MLQFLSRRIDAIQTHDKKMVIVLYHIDQAHTVMSGQILVLL
jgi:hypothetical protein